MYYPKQFNSLSKNLQKLFIRTNRHFNTQFRIYFKKAKAVTIISLLTLIAAIIGTIYSYKTYDFNQDTYDQEVKTDIALEGYLEFNTVYISNDRHFESFRNVPKIPQTLSLRYYRTFIINPFIAIRIYNKSMHAVSIKDIRGYLTTRFIDSLTNDTAIRDEHEYQWQEVYHKDFEAIDKLPLYLETEKEDVFLFPIPWPITSSLYNYFSDFTGDTIYGASELYDEYLSKNNVYAFGVGEIGGLEIRRILINDLSIQYNAKDILEQRICLRLELSSGELLEYNFKI